MSPPAALATVLLRPAVMPLERPFVPDPDVSRKVNPSTYLLDSVFRI
jgi:hypothetical protein